MRSLIFAMTVVALGAGAPRMAGQAAGVDLGAFAGVWKQNQAKSTAFISAALTYTFSQEADGFVRIERGRVPLRDHVRLDGQEYPTPGVPGRTTAWTKVADLVYESTITRDGKLLGTGRWTLSADGSRLTQETRPLRADGQDDTNIIEYVRTSGEGNWLIGVWKPASSRSVVPDQFVVTPIDGAALNVFNPNKGSNYTIRPDGKEYSITGPSALPDMTASAEALGPRTLRRTTLLAHSPNLEVTMNVSVDGRTMTVTTRMPDNEATPSVFVYEKQD